ncbi:transposase [Elysia marginata]|uniref:Transposase n=1 Tax=Elysia marginata TaxID=1093978 RepID=A0AAV4JUW2_9GAST|nr:transposase [Elysia marginata]
MFEPHDPKRLSDTITGDETWFPFFIIPPKRPNRKWVDGQGDRPVVFRQGFQSRKRMFTVFFIYSGPLVVDILPQDTNSDYHILCPGCAFPERWGFTGSIESRELLPNAVGIKRMETGQARGRDEGEGVAAFDMVITVSISRINAGFCVDKSMGSRRGSLVLHTDDQVLNKLVM